MYSGLAKIVCGGCGHSSRVEFIPEKCPGCGCQFDEQVVLDDDLDDDELLKAIENHENR